MTTQGFSFLPPERKYVAHLYERVSPKTVHDISEDLAKFYDLITSSMDWGSGFLDEEDYAGVIKVGVLCGFDLPGCDQYFRSVAFRFRRDDGEDRVLFGKCESYRTHPGHHQARLRYMVERLQPEHTTVPITWSRT